MIYRGGITFMFLMVLVSMQTINGGLLPHIVEKLALADLGQHTHTLASSSANAASNAFTGLRSYFGGWRGGLIPGRSYIPIGGVYPGGVVQQGGGAASSAAAAASAASSAADRLGDRVIIARKR